MKEYIDKIVTWVEELFFVYPALKLALVSLAIVIAAAYAIKALLF